MSSTRRSDSLTDVLLRDFTDSPYKPRHLARRADVEPDSSVTSRCLYHAMWDCGDWKCPRHNPESYADSMARHAAETCPTCGSDHGHAAYCLDECWF